MIAFKAGGRLPAQYCVLLAAKEWGKAPWQVVPGGKRERLFWFLYWSTALELLESVKAPK